ncbi:MAG: 2-hydroxyacyl-CoA dehydratase family protein [Bacillota bacterium]|nr:2-hydroxyacyl-CoA dehydratase family protein [Bacillota bacterium]
MNTEVLEIFRQAVEDPGKEVREWKEKKGGKVVGFLLTDVPEELIHAAGFFPFGICGGTVRMDQVEAHLQFWSCSYVRNSLALALDGKLDFLDGLVIPHTCDTTRMLMGIWKHVRPLPFMDSFRLPRQVGRPSAKQYVVGELRRIKDRLDDFRGTEITDEELSQSFKLYNSNRNLLRKLFNLHEQNPASISNKDLYTVVKASMVIEREKLNMLLSELVSVLAENAGTPNDKTKIFISGTFLEPLDLLNYIDESGGAIVGDDLKNGFRYIESDVAEAGDPLEALAERQLKRIPSASYDIPENLRRHFLVKTAQQKGVQGVILLHVKYCEPENYDYYDNIQALEKAGIPALRIETEFGDTSLGQLSTRVQAFMEMVGGE